MATLAKPRSATSTAGRRIAAAEWQRVGDDLDAQGFAVIEDLLGAEACGGVAGLYPDDARFRSRIVMARHGFGRGEYKYFAYPLPDPVARLRTALYPPLAAIANRWNEAMGIDVRYPADARGVPRSAATTPGQTRPTPLLLQYGAGDYNCLHQDLYGEHVFPLQVGDPAVRAGRGLHGRRVRADRAAPAHAVARRGRAAAAGRCGGLPGASSAGARHARHLSRQHAPRRERHPLGRAPHARHHLPRRQVIVALVSR